MDDLISRNSVLEILKKYSWCDLTDYLEFGKIKMALYKLPVLITTPIVRCKDCTWYHNGYCKSFNDEVEPDEFCSRGHIET